MLNFNKSKDENVKICILRPSKELHPDYEKACRMGYCSVKAHHFIPNIYLYSSDESSYIVRTSILKDMIKKAELGKKTRLYRVINVTTGDIVYVQDPYSTLYGCWFVDEIGFRKLNMEDFWDEG